LEHTARYGVGTFFNYVYCAPEAHQPPAENSETRNLAPSAQARSGSLQAATSGDLKVAATSAIEIPKQKLSFANK